MSNNSSYMLFLAFMFMGIIISVSSNNWLGCWMGIEVNMISFLPLMADKMNIYSSESMISYFIIQSMASSMLFISILLVTMFNFGLVMVISLMIKIGCPPFHLWFPSVMEGLSWMMCFLLSTVQKLIPMILLTNLMFNFSLFIILSCCLGAIGGLGYSSMRKIIAYSSIYNLGWMISGIMMVNYSWLFYFSIYSLNLFMVCYTFNSLNVNYLNQFFVFSKIYMNSLLMMVLFMSMGGLPPFLGFIPKLVLIYCLVLNNLLFPCFILVMTALLVLFFYMRIVYTGMMINSMSLMVKFYSMYSLSWMFYVFGILSIFGLFILLMMSLFF
uniref:NADH-ubiquinone oxidoreductase chain 2 n=1 Tax=Diceroprocta semicincta TaxID=946270 RepID=A0A088DMY7_9HEMI|nr:NADH dehydrogenase subunit 2 [Diceroprocta semicincta]